MRFPAGASLTEFRLRVGFVHLPVPLLTYGAQPSLHRISNSQAMRPWRVRNPHYDRPIPRRLVEEAGIPRELFGRRKRAVTQPFYHNEPLRQIMSQRSYRDFLDFCGARRPGHGSREQAVALAVLPRVHAVQSLVSRGLSFAAGWLGISFSRWGRTPSRSTGRRTGLGRAMMSRPTALTRAPPCRSPRTGPRLDG
jgi:hypothetical protein